MQNLTSNESSVSEFIQRWQKSGGSEKANYALFLTELCDLLDLPHPHPAGPDNAQNLYTFERSVSHKEADGTASVGYIDLYKSGCFLMETKQGTFQKAEEGTLLNFIPSNTLQKTGHGKRGTLAFDKVLQRAYNQARKYITALPSSEGRPPFLIVCDVGHTIDLYAEFSGTGGQYERFPDPVSHRIYLEDLQKPEIRQRLRSVWTEPQTLDPSKHAAAVTREVAKVLAELAKSLEKDGHDAKVTAGFLQRCLFTMFAEDVGLLPQNSFLQVLEKVKDSPQGFPVMLHALWKDMAHGAPFSTVLLQAIPHFNGGLFEDATALPLRPDQMQLLIHAAKSDWSAVEPAIFGTLIERALDPKERHKLGAHYTPRSYVERLVRPTLMDPLREEWETVKAAASLSMEKATKADASSAKINQEVSQNIQTLDKKKAAELNKKYQEALKLAATHRDSALGAVKEFHRKLCTLRVLDPACGSGNFLYVALELMKRLEAEVLEAYEDLGGDAAFEMTSFKIGPRQFLGLEINRRAVAIAQLVLWIGFFQWQRKTTGKADTNERPLLPKEPSILQQDAVLAYDKAIPRIDPETGKEVTIWDGFTTKPHPITGKDVPDETSRKLVYDYTNPRRAEWPDADVIVGNPPFIGARTNRQSLGDGYLKALRSAHPTVPANVDFVMYWWHHAAELVQQGHLVRFGLITTNSITQSFNQAVVAAALNDSLQLSYAIPDHPWIDSAEGAAVRIAMTVVGLSGKKGVLETVRQELATEDDFSCAIEFQTSYGIIGPKLTVDCDITSASELQANAKISCVGYQLTGKGFVVGKSFYESLPENHRRYIHPLLTARDIVQNTRSALAIDVSLLCEQELQSEYPVIYQHLLVHVQPERKVNNRKSVRENWWVYGEARNSFRPAIKQLRKFVVTPLTSKHRIFISTDSLTIADSTTVVFAFEDFAILGILSSATHGNWSLKAGGHLGVGNDSRYNKTRCFETFPFPALEEGPLKQRIRDLGERLDAHRKKQQALHPELTLTGMYNVLEAVRSGAPLNAKEKIIHDHGLISILKQIHDDLDQAVFEAYGWQDLGAIWQAMQNGQFYDRETGAVTCYELDPETAEETLTEAKAKSDEAFQQELLTRLVALNHERAAEEKRGLIRWLRPEYQAPSSTTAPISETEKAPNSKSKSESEQEEMELPSATAAKAAEASAETLTWPTSLPNQVSAVQKLVPTLGPTAELISARFGKKSPKRTEQISEILEMLKSLGQL